MVTEGQGSGIRLVMADDHAPTRGVIRAALEEGGCQVCGEGATAQEAIDLALGCDPDVVLLDIHMPGNGIHAAEVIAKELPQTAIVMLTSSQEDEDLFEALQAGASGYLLKTADPQDLDDAAAAAAAYLCGTGQDLATGPGWSAAIYAYNHSASYVSGVYLAATTYADRAR